MKDSKEYSKKIKALYRSLKRGADKSTKVEYDDPVESLVYATLSENITDTQAQSAFKRLKDYFVDWNDLRVAMVDEITEVLGPDVTATRNVATVLINSLRAIFEKYNVLSLQALRKLGKRQAKQVLEKLNSTTPFVVDYCMLTSLQGHAIPLTPKMIEYLKTNELVSNEADYAQIEGFLARQISTKNAHEFYFLLRHGSESTRSRKTEKSKSKKKK